MFSKLKNGLYDIGGVCASSSIVGAAILGMLALVTGDKALASGAATLAVVSVLLVPLVTIAHIMPLCFVQTGLVAVTALGLAPPVFGVPAASLSGFAMGFWILALLIHIVYRAVREYGEPRLV